MVRQILGAVSQFEKAALVAKLRGARDRKRATGAKVEGRKSHAERAPATVARALALRADGLTLAQVKAQLDAEGCQTSAGKPYHLTAVGRMISGRTR
jgi:DNA invertase Pin-like site-specific DNA recombinase